MVPELADDTENGAIKLSSHEVASRLAFLLWGSVPDDTLNTAADADQLTTKEQVLAQAQRMVQDRAKTAPIVALFHRAYADIRDGSHWGTVEHDATRWLGARELDEVDWLEPDRPFLAGLAAYLE